MTPEQTRQLGIEFERRIQAMAPAEEFLNKLDTQTIYSYLNQYQDKYVKDVFKALDGLQSGTNVSIYAEAILQSLLTRDSKPVPEGTNTGDTVVYELNDSFEMYVRSVSKVSTSYQFKKTAQTQGVLPNKLVSQKEAQMFEAQPNDSLRILREPIAYLSQKQNGSYTLTIIYDKFTTPTQVDVYYYKRPAYFDIMTNTACELPYECFDDLVTGAVDLYVQYAAGATSNKQKQSKKDKQDKEESEQ